MRRRITDFGLKSRTPAGWLLMLWLTFSTGLTAAGQTPPPEVAEAKPVTSGNKAESRHRVQMRISGSSCLSCLSELERKLKEQPGVDKVKIDFPSSGGSFFGMQGPLWSLANISYQPEKLPLPKLLQFIEQQGYHAYKIVDKVVR
jgi:copper chaperone CopZ